jgi:hypothetical protein
MSSVAEHGLNQYGSPFGHGRMQPRCVVSVSIAMTVRTPVQFPCMILHTVHSLLRRAHSSRSPNQLRFGPRDQDGCVGAVVSLV